MLKDKQWNNIALYCMQCWKKKKKQEQIDKQFITYALKLKFYND